MSDVRNLVERLRQIAESQRMDFDSPNVAATLDDAATTLEALASIGSVVAEEPEERWQYGAQNPDDADGKIVAWSRGFTKRLVEQQGHRLFRRTPGVPAGPWVEVTDD